MEIKPKVDTATRKWLMTADSFRHPAKMSIPMLLWIVQKYTKLGDVILDPMAGAGTTMLACWMGRNVLLVELESKFIDMCNANWEKLRHMPPALGFEMGWCVIKQGDARQLEEVLADVAIFSPPYAEATHEKQFKSPEELEQFAKEQWVFKHGRSLEATKRYMEKSWQGYPDTPEQIGNLPYGSIDAAIFSPPYSEQIQSSRHSDHQPGRRAERLRKAGYDVAKYQGGVGRQCDVVWEYGKTKNNIGNLPHGDIDAIISSPPYEGSMDSRNPIKGWSEEAQRKWWDNYRSQGGGMDFEPFIKYQAEQQYSYSASASNLGNLKGDTYLQAMWVVYLNCWLALKPNGLMILVTKNFIRNKQIVPLDKHTISLCESVGFTLQERHHRKLTSQSFWRVIYQKKYPDAPVIDKEDILIFQK